MTLVPPKYAAVRVRLTQADRDALAARAVREDVPMSVLIRRAIRKYMNPTVTISTTPAGAMQPEHLKTMAKFLSSSDGRGGA